LIDTDFEYGLQPTKWETVELINNTPSFFSKGGDTTIPNISAVTTTETSREIKVITSLAHGLAVGIPINVTGTKSITADGAYIINSVPDAFTFTYLCRQNQPTTASIEDLYTSIITGEFFQGSQIRISDSEGLVTNGEGQSVLTVKTESPHGFGVNTPFYFLNLNSTVSQEFDSSNTSSKAFDSSNSSTAQTFDGSNTLTSYRLDLDNNAVSGGAVSSISNGNLTTNAITVTHTTENFINKAVGTPLYHNVSSASGYFSANPRGVVFLKDLNTATTNGSIFTVSLVPNGSAISISSSVTGTFQLANEARTFAGNNVDVTTETTINLVDDDAKTFNGANLDGLFVTNASFSGSQISGASGSGLADITWYQGAMLKYETTGTPPTINSGGDATAGGSTTSLVNGRTYFVDSFFQQGSTINYSFTLKEFPTSSTTINTTSSGSGTHTFTQIGLAVDKDIFHLKDHGYAINDMLKYSYPDEGRFGVASPSTEQKDFYFVQQLYGTHNFTVNWTVGELTPRTQEFIGSTATQSSITTQSNPQGWTAPITFAVTSGTLPAGLTLNTTTGVITGTPSDFNGYTQATVRVTLTDSSGGSDFMDITFQINPAPFLYSFTSATFTPGGAQRQDGPSITQTRSGVGNPSWANQYIQSTGQQGIFLWTVPQTATYRIEAYGARGGTTGDVGYSRYGYYDGGFGARMRGDFSLTQGDQIKMLVGQRGHETSHSQDGRAVCSGGGGSFVVRSNNSILVIAGGGGGSASNNWSQHRGQDGTTSQNGTYSTSGGGQPGTGGQGANGDTTGGPAAGFYGDGNTPSGTPYSERALSFLNGGRGGRAARSWGGGEVWGGFGGGGGGGGLAAGGGGGYSGGAGGQWSQYQGGGGGGSLNNGANQSNSGGNRNGDGFIVIQKL
jgi:hypothetical protein